MRHFLGLDISMTSTGYAVVTVEDDGSLTLQTTGYIATTSKESDGVRLSKIRERLELLLHMYEFDTVIKENGFVKGHHATKSIFKATGVVEEVVNTVSKHGDIVAYPPTTVKKTVTGDGKADKRTVADCVKTFIEIPWAIKRDDESDAIAIILTHLIKEGIING
jgi:crossover junction endodeoxyribonuclease RuvC